MTRSRELRRIEAAIEHRNRPELEWALRECELRKRFAKTHSGKLYRLERRIREALAEVEDDSD